MYLRKIQISMPYAVLLGTGMESSFAVRSSEDYGHNTVLILVPGMSTYALRNSAAEEGTNCREASVGILLDNQYAICLCCLPRLPHSIV